VDGLENYTSVFIVCIFYDKS